MTTIAASMSLAERVRSWATLLARFASLQLLVQALGFLAGLLILRLLSKEQYGWFTIANGLQMTVTLLADAGVGIGLTSIGGRVWQDRDKLGRLLASARSLRRILGGIALLGLVPMMAWLLWKNGCPPGVILWLVLLMIVGAPAQVNADVLLTAPRLHGQVLRLQRIEALCNGLRLGALLLLMLPGWLSAGSALSVATAAFWLQLRLLRPISAALADPAAESDPAYRAEIIGLIKPLAANVVFFCFQGQIGAWLVGIFGQAQNVAELGALGRLGLLFSVFNVFQGSVIMPRFSRLPAHAPLLRRRYLQVVTIAAVGSTLVWLGAFLLPRALLFILGPKYSHLETELHFFMAETVIAYFGSVLWSMNFARAWVKWSWFYIPLTIGAQAAALPFLNLGRVRDVIILGTLPHLLIVLLNFAMTWDGLRRTARAEAETSPA